MLLYNILSPWTCDIVEVEHLHLKNVEYHRQENTGFCFPVSIIPSRSGFPSGVYIHRAVRLPK